MASQDRAERLRQAIVEAAARLEATVHEPKRGGGPAPGDLYVFNTPVESAIEWLVVRFHVDDPAILLLAPADDLPLAGQCDVGLWPEFLDRPLTVRCGESAWLPASMCAGHLRVGMVPDEAVGEVRRVIAALARGNMPNDAVREFAEADPEYMAWLDEVAHARQALEDLSQREPIAIEGAVLELDQFSTTPPAWLPAETNFPLAADGGSGLIADVAESLASASVRYADVALKSGGKLLLTAGGGGVRVGWKGQEGTEPPALAGVGGRGKLVATWSNVDQPGFHRAKPLFGWLDGQVVLVVGSDHPETITIRL